MTCISKKIIVQVIIYKSNVIHDTEVCLSFSPGYQYDHEVDIGFEQDSTLIPIKITFLQPGTTMIYHTIFRFYIILFQFQLIISEFLMPGIYFITLESKNMYYCKTVAQQKSCRCCCRELVNKMKVFSLTKNVFCNRATVGKPNSNKKNKAFEKKTTQK